ncbi:IS1 family transposase [Empedobacter tilapiae]|uniref:IS1 family transposase n=1 Tax=Empedobacter tilapiae TaxID=2491114 RepID=A0A4Z1BMH6_9FLAO|nr:IS1 family transposase [Empedobacter tilapiae]TGN26079.1 IS1 family transposase [Empedobacter tilapiae]
MLETSTLCIRVSDTQICPFCYSRQIVKNGHTKTRKQQFFCKKCNHRFLDFYSYKGCHLQINRSIVQLVKEGLGIRSIARVLNISTTTLLKRIILLAQKAERPILVYGKKYELDELRFYIQHKKNLQWLVYALDHQTRKVISFYIGKRTNKTLNIVVKTLLYSKAERICTDKLPSYRSLIPKNIHCTKQYGTNHIERKNLDIRTSLRRFQRRTICFSKSLRITTAILKIYFWM